MLDWIERGDVHLVVNTPTGVGARTDGYEIRRAAVAHGIPCLTTLAAGISAARAIASAHRNGAPEVLCLQELHGAARSRRRRARWTPPDRRDAGGVSRAVRRALTVTGNDELGAYRVLRAADPGRPAGRARAVRDDRRRRALGRGRGRAAVPPARLLHRPPAGGECHFLLEDVGPGTQRLCELRPGDGCGRSGRSGAASRAPRDGRRALLVGGGVGIAPLAILQDTLASADATVLLGFRDARTRRGRRAAATTRSVATDDGSVGHHGLVTELLAAELERDPHAVVYACGPAGHARGRQRACASSRAVPAQLALEAGMACGFGACFGCVVPRRGGGYLRVCVDGPVIDAAAARARRRSTPEAPAMSVEFCGLTLAHPVINGSGTFDAIAARRVFGEQLRERFPFAAYVSKTITLAPRAGNPPPRLWETPAGLINSIGLPNKGLERLPRRGPAAARRARHRHAGAAAGVPLITNVMGASAEELARLLEACDERAEIAAIELNVSCPNVDTGPRHRRRPAPARGRSCAPCAGARASR